MFTVSGESTFKCLEGFFGERIVSRHYKNITLQCEINDENKVENFR